jgi:hypothetical protein
MRLLTARHFGIRNFGALFGLIAGLSMFGAGAAPVLANAVYDLTKCNDAVLWAMAPASVFACGLFIAMGRYPVLEGGRVPRICPLRPRPPWPDADP